MAVIHVTEAEAARDLPALIVQVQSGTQVYIDGTDGPVAVLNSPAYGRGDPPPMSLSEAIALLDRIGSHAVQDEGSAEAVMAGIKRHEHEYLRDPWE